MGRFCSARHGGYMPIRRKGRGFVTYNRSLRARIVRDIWDFSAPLKTKLSAACPRENRAFGVEHGSATGPIAIPKNYFWKGAEIDFDEDTVAALGRKFWQVTVQGERELAGEAPSELRLVDPGLIQSQLELESEVAETLTSELARSSELPDQGEPQSPHEVPPRSDSVRRTVSPRGTGPCRRVATERARAVEPTENGPPAFGTRGLRSDP